MVAHKMPLAQHPPDKVRVLLDVIADDEKRRLHVVLCQRVQDRLRAAVFIARVKGQVDLLFCLVPQIDRVVPPQRLGRGVADRRLALRAEAQPPGTRFYGAALLKQRRQRRAERQHCRQRQIQNAADRAHQVDDGVAAAAQGLRGHIRHQRNCRGAVHAHRNKQQRQHRDEQPQNQRRGRRGIGVVQHGQQVHQ